MALNRVVALLAALVYVAGLLAPNHYFPWTAYYNEIPAGLALLLIVFCCLLPKGAPHCLLPRHLLYLLVLPLIPLLQWGFGLLAFAGDAWVATLYLSGATLACFCGFMLSNTNQCGARVLVNWVSWVLLIGALLSTLIALRQVFGMSGSLWEMRIPQGGRPVANLGQPNQLTTLLLLGFISLVHLRTIRRVGNIGFVISASVLGVGIAATQSRSSLLVVLALAGWLLWKLPQVVAERRQLLTAALGSLGAILLLWFCWPYFLGLWQTEGEVVTRSISDPARLVIWQQMFEAVTLSPLFGYGWGQVGMAQLAVAGSWATGGMLQSTHNIFADLIIWNGVPIGAILVITIATWGIRRMGKTQTIASWYALGVIGTVLVHAMLEYPLHYSYFLLPTAAMVGVVESEFGRNIARVHKLVIGAFSLFSLTLFILILIEYPSVEEGVRSLRFRAIGVTGRGDGQISNDAQRLKILTQMKGFIEFSLGSTREGMTQGELESMRVVSRRFPYPSSIFSYALALALNGHPESAKQELGILRNIHGEADYQKAINDLLMLRDRHPQLAKLNLDY